MLVSNGFCHYQSRDITDLGPIQVPERCLAGTGLTPWPEHGIHRTNARSHKSAAQSMVEH